MDASAIPLSIFFFFYGSEHPRNLHSFPTRRSSDLKIRSRRICFCFERDFAGPPGVFKVGWNGFSSGRRDSQDRKSTRLNSSHVAISYAVFCLKKKKLFSLVSAGTARAALANPRPSA